MTTLSAIGVAHLSLIFIIISAPVILFIFGYYLGKHIGYAKRAREFHQ